MRRMKSITPLPMSQASGYSACREAPDQIMYVLATASLVTPLEHRHQPAFFESVHRLVERGILESMTPTAAGFRPDDGWPARCGTCAAGPGVAEGPEPEWRDCDPGLARFAAI